MTITLLTSGDGIPVTHEYPTSIKIMNSYSNSKYTYGIGSSIHRFVDLSVYITEMYYDIDSLTIRRFYDVDINFRYQSKA